MAVSPGPIPFDEIPIRDRASMTDALRARRQALGLPQLAVDQIAGLADGYTAKLETPNRFGVAARAIGWESLPLVLGALGLDLRAVRRAACTSEEKANAENSMEAGGAEFMRERGRRLAKARWAKATLQQRKQAVIRMNRARLRKRRRAAAASRP